MAKKHDLPGYVTKEVEIEGRSPLLMHSCRAVNTRDPIKKEMKKITDKKANKTSDDEDLLADLEWLGCVYTEFPGELSVTAAGARLSDTGRIVIPSTVIEGCIRDAARVTRQGKNIVAGLECVEDVPLIHDGPDDLMDMCRIARFRDVRRVVVSKSGVMRTRPVFHKWAAEFTLRIDPNVFDVKKLDDILRTAGTRIGLMDFRPKYGRFSVVGVK